LGSHKDNVRTSFRLQQAAILRPLLLDWALSCVDGHNPWIPYRISDHSSPPSWNEKNGLQHTCPMTIADENIRTWNTKSVEYCRLHVKDHSETTLDLRQKHDMARPIPNVPFAATLSEALMVNSVPITCWLEMTITLHGDCDSEVPTPVMCLEVCLLGAVKAFSRSTQEFIERIHELQSDLDTVDVGIVVQLLRMTDAIVDGSQCLDILHGEQQQRAADTGEDAYGRRQAGRTLTETNLPEKPKPKLFSKPFWGPPY
jgi:hypothetical protein